MNGFWASIGVKYKKKDTYKITGEEILCLTKFYVRMMVLITQRKP